MEPHLRSPPLEHLCHLVDGQRPPVALLAQVPKQDGLGRRRALRDGMLKEGRRLHVVQVESTRVVRVPPEQLEVVVGLDEDEAGVGEVREDARVVMEVGAHDDRPLDSAFTRGDARSRSSERRGRAAPRWTSGGNRRRRTPRPETPASAAAASTPAAGGIRAPARSRRYHPGCGSPRVRARGAHRTRRGLRGRETRPPRRDAWPDDHASRESPELSLHLHAAIDEDGGRRGPERQAIAGAARAKGLEADGQGGDIVHGEATGRK